MKQQPQLSLPVIFYQNLQRFSYKRIMQKIYFFFSSSSSFSSPSSSAFKKKKKGFKNLLNQEKCFLSFPPLILLINPSAFSDYFSYISYSKKKNFDKILTYKHNNNDNKLLCIFFFFKSGVAVIILPPLFPIPYARKKKRINKFFFEY